MPFKRNALSASIALGLGIAVYATNTEAANEQTPSRTGSRVSGRLEQSQPITVITRRDIDSSGEVSVADILRQTTFNSFGSSRETSGWLVRGQAQIDLRGLGPQRTLVLLDGRRLAGTATQSGGQTANLNLIPAAAVERIEILRDGASAIHGSEAIGGVVNIIMRKDYEGLHLGAQWDKPTQSGGDGSYGQIVAGVTSGRGNITVSVDHEERGIILDRDRPFSSVGLSAFGFPASFARVATGGTFNVIAGDPNSGTTFSPDPRCPTTFGQSPSFPNSQLNAANGICNYNFAAVSAATASLRRDSLFVNVNYDLSDTVSFFGRFLSTNNESFGRAAPTPATFPQVSLAASNPNNPTAGEAGGPYDLTVLFRTVPLGPRDSTAHGTLFDVLVGLDGTFDWFGGFDWEFALQQSRTQTFTRGENYGLQPSLQAAVDNGSLDVFSGRPNPDALDNIRHTIFQFAENRLFGGGVTVSWDLLQTSSGSWPLALGFEYMDEQFALRHDAQSTALNVVDTQPVASLIEPRESVFLQDAAGERSRYALFGELLVPLGARLEATLALRHDHYNDFGDTTNPKLAAAFRPTDRWVLRASYGKGFRAPDLAVLHEPQRVAPAHAVDTLSCSFTGEVPNDPAFDPEPNHPCLLQQYNILIGGNPNLGPEESDLWTAGATWSPIDGVVFDINYYDIETTGVIGSLDAQTAFDNELRASRQGRPLRPSREGDVIRGPNDEVLLVVIPYVNSTGVATRGFDMGIEWRFAHGTAGDWRWWIIASKVIDLRRSDQPIDAPQGSQFVTDLAVNEVAGTLGAPALRVNTGLDWSRGNWSASTRLYYLDDTTASLPGHTAQGHVPSWTTWDVQVGYAFGWDGEIMVGIRNVADRDPPVSPAFGFPNWSSNNYDALGRVPYLRYVQDL